MRLPASLLALTAAAPTLALEPIPDKLVVLTFDDASRSHVEVAAPLTRSGRSLVKRPAICGKRNDLISSRAELAPKRWRLS
jgi:hypothetical protein